MNMRSEMRRRAARQRAEIAGQADMLDQQAREDFLRCMLACALVNVEGFSLSAPPKKWWWQGYITGVREALGESQVTPEDRREIADAVHSPKATSRAMGEGYLMGSAGLAPW